MRDFTTTEIIRALPLERNFKKKLLLEYEDMSENDQLAVVQIVWDAFIDFQEALEQYYIDKVNVEVASGDRICEGDLMDEVDREVEKEIERRIVDEHSEKKDLEDVRKQIELILDKNTDEQS